MTRMMSSTTTEGAAREDAQLASSNGSRVRLRNRPKTTAPVMSSSTMAEIRRLSTVVVQACRSVRFLVTRTISSAPNAPTAPASVGVNQPAAMPPITRANRKTTSITPVNARSFLPQDTFGPGGPRCGRRQHSRSTVATSATPTMNPGRTAAVNSWVIDCSDWMAMMISAVEGGITTPSVPPMAILPPDSPGLYPYYFISGSATDPMVAVVAELDPDTAENPMLARMVVAAMPPGSEPIQSYAAA